MALSTLLSYTNIVLLVTSRGTGLKKFAAYDGEREDIAINDVQTLKELNYYYVSGKALKIRAGNDVINNAYIETKPFELSSASLDKTLYSITFKEGFDIVPVYVGLPNARRGSNASRVNSGQKQGQKVNHSWSAGVTDAIIGLIRR